MLDSIKIVHKDFFIHFYNIIIESLLHIHDLFYYYFLKSI